TWAVGGRARASDAGCMRRALALAARGLGRTWPNPPVGAVLVRGGRVIGEGFHTRAGAPHAEIEALRAARGRPRGAELFVTLEPCSHHGRTPPCADALLGLGLSRVVVAVPDPNPRVRGRGIRTLRAHGIPVTVGIEATAAGEPLPGFRSSMRRRRPPVMLKLASTLDGRIAARGGDARWITGPAARRRGHELRDVHDAILVGAGTVRADDPALTCRIRGGHHPVRVILAGPRLDLPPGARILDVRAAPTWVVTTGRAQPSRVRRLRRRRGGVVTPSGRGRA